MHMPSVDRLELRLHTDISSGGLFLFLNPTQEFGSLLFIEHTVFPSECFSQRVTSLTSACWPTFHTRLQVTEGKDPAYFVHHLYPAESSTDPLFKSIVEGPFLYFYIKASTTLAWEVSWELLEAAHLLWGPHAGWWHWWAVSWEGISGNQWY